MKMKLLFTTLVLVTALCCSINTWAASYWYVHDFACDNCHKVGADLTSLAGNVCLNCHGVGSTGGSSLAHVKNIGGPTMTPSKNFSVDMASDALGTRTAEVGALADVAGSQTSHNWNASDNNPAAGASAPSDARFYGRSNYSGAVVACSRCHDPHGLAVDYLSAKANPKLLKLGVDSENAMCVGCHTSWDTTNANAYLTHPLQANYPAFQQANLTKYKIFTPNGQMALDASGNIVCATCHGTHFTDSDAATTDGPGQTLSVGDGRMLKGNGKLTGDTTSLCQSCHTYSGHGTTGQVGCLDCHSGHSYNNGSPNYFVLRNNVSLAAYPASAPSNPGTNLDYTSLTSAWKNGGNGYCEGCHTLPATHNGLTTGGQAECTSCHNHDSSTAFGASCNTCHGYPPVNGTVQGGPDGYAYDAATSHDYNADPNFKDDTNTKHGLHAGTGAGQYKFSCDECHNGNSHDSGTFQDVFITPTNFVTDGGQLAPTYDKTGSGTCSAVYCHSNGGPRGAAPTAATIPTWLNGSSVTCSSCHGNDTTSMTNKGNSATHQAHLAKGYDCSLCHNSTASNATTLAAGAAGGSHVNGTADVVFDAAATPTQVQGVRGVYGTDGTCQNIYCHSGGPSATTSAIPDWDLPATGACGTCHQVNATGDTGMPLPGAHTKHVFDANGPKLACTVCHTNNGSGADHVDGFASMVTNYPTAVCDVCHGATAAGTGVDAEPDWSTPASVSCRTCHQGTLADFGVISGPVAPAQDSFYTLGHGKASLTGAPDCTGCHDTSFGQHFDGVSGDPQLTGGTAVVANEAFCQTCHSAKAAHFTATVSTNANSCYFCHEPHGNGVGAGFDAMLLTSVGPVGAKAPSAVTGFTDKTQASSYWNVGNTGICQVCHDPAGGTGGINHYNRTTHDGHNSTTACITCHNHNDPTVAFKASASTCEGCHAGTIASNGHPAHVNKNGGTIDSDKSDCAACHGAQVNGADPYTLTGGGGGLHQNGTVDFAAGIADGGVTPAETCTAACHNQPSGLTAVWNSGTIACDACHGQPPADGGGDALAHSKHVAVTGIDCTTCHGGPMPTDQTHATQGTGTDLAILQNMAQALPSEATITDASWNATNHTCNNAACHNPSGGAYAADWDTSNSTGNCALCHSSSDPATGSHTSHVNNAALIGDNLQCTDCHVDNSGNTAHRNGTVDVLASLTYNGEVSIPSTGVGNCSTSQCHAVDQSGSSPYFIYAPSPNWGDNSTPDKCTICHSKPPASGDHQSHWSATRQANGMSCQSCHNGTAKPDFTIVPGGSHLNAIPQVSGFTDVAQGGTYNSQPVTIGYTLGTTVPSTCTASCHSDQVNPRDWAPATSCEACHSNLTTDATHAKHISIAGGIETDRSECVLCHGSQVNNYATAGGGDPLHGNGTVNFASGIADGGSAPNQTCTAACHGSSATDGFWGDTALNCTACHNNGTNDNNIAHAAPATGSHAAHVTTAGLGCADCHGTLPTDTTHISGLDASGAIPATDGAKLTAKATPIADNATVDDSPFDQAGNTFVDANNTCSNTYCHDPSNQGKTVTWGVDTVSCALCHGDDQAGTKMATGTHGNHLNATGTFGLTIGCNRCHPDNTGNYKHFVKTTGPTTVNQAVQFGGTVITGAQQTAVDGKYSGEVALPNTAYGTCGTTACHNNGQGGAPNNSTYTWGATAIGSCLLCHNNMPTTGAHATHLNSNIKYGPYAKVGGSTNCGKCHAANANNSSMAGQTTHINGTISFVGAKEVSSGGIGTDTTVTVCDTCHGGTTAVNLASTGAKAKWSVGGPVACESCHGDYNQANVDGALAPHEAGPAYDNSGHGKTGVAKACVDCHDHQGNHIGYTTKRLNTISGKDFNVDPNGFCNACHTTLVNSSAHYANTQTANGTSDDALTCVTCHDQHGQNGGQDAMIASTIQSHPVAGFTDRTARTSYANASNNGVCQVCHDPAEVQHFNRTGEELATHNAGQICTTCHAHTDTPIFKPSGCNGCHGGGTTGATASNFWPDSSNANVENTAGRHLKHMNVLAERVYGMTAVALLDQPTADAAQKALCEYCHAALVNDSDHGSTANLPAEVFVDADSVRHAKSLWGAADADESYAGGSCSNVDCHNSKVTGTVTYGWYDAGTSTCTLCHTPGGTGANPTTGLHTVVNNPTEVQVHDNTLGTNGCTECHNALPAIDNTAASTHINGTFAADSAVNDDRGVGVGGNITAFTQAASGTSDSCASNCHSDAGSWQRLWSKDADSTSNAVGAPRCNVCHGYLNNWRVGMTPDHSTKTAINNGTHGNCSTCHVRPNAPYAVATYHDTNSPLGSPTELGALGHAVEMNVTVGYDMAAGNCTNICHTNDAQHTLGTSSHFPANDLNGPAADCNTCHLATGGSNNTNTVGSYTFNNRVGAHAKHVASAATAYGDTVDHSTAANYDYGCGLCHPANSSNHQNGVLDLILTPSDAPASIKGKNGAAAAYSASSCSAVYCHGDGVTPGTSPNFLTGSFTNPNGDYCQNCHGNQPTTSSHAKHTIGIHSDDVYSGTSGTLTEAAASGAGHGDVGTALTITCAVCHNSTVNQWYNGNNTTCVSCHGTAGVATDKTVITSADLDKSFHVNGTKDVAFAPVNPLRSKAQVRDFTPGEPELYNNWTRTNGYKAGVTSHDQGVALNTATMWTSATKNCTVTCHNGNPATWGSTGNSCDLCHTQLPK